MADVQVHIVGAGPGDADLLTVKAYRLLTQWAEVVVYDRLISEQILGLIPESVQRVYAGKSCKHHTMTQADINAELVKQAKDGKKVLRLKGGDPLMFGRGGEEAQFLAQHNISYQITAGVSAASGIAAHVGVPLTHRGVANNVQFITGHQQNHQEIALDWQKLAQEDTTLVIYMGLANISLICTQLAEAGLAVNTPAMAIENGTTANQRVCSATLAALPAMLKTQKFTPPTIIIIGKVVDLAVI